MAKKMTGRKVLLTVTAIVLVAAIGVGAFFLLKGKEPTPSDGSSEPKKPTLVRNETAAADHIGVIHVEQEEVVDGESKVLITLTDVDSNTLDTYETVIRDDRGIGDVKIMMPEEKDLCGGVLLTGSKMQPTLVSFFGGQLYGATILEWVETEGRYDENDQPVGTWTEVTLPNGDKKSLPRIASEGWLPENASFAGVLAEEMLKYGEEAYILREVPLPGDWVEFYKPIFFSWNYKVYHAFEICSPSGEVKARTVLDAMRIKIDFQFDGESKWRRVSIGMEDGKRVFYLG